MDPEVGEFSSSTSGPVTQSGYRATQSEFSGNASVYASSSDMRSLECHGFFSCIGQDIGHIVHDIVAAVGNDGFNVSVGVGTGAGSGPSLYVGGCAQGGCGGTAIGPSTGGSSGGSSDSSGGGSNISPDSPSITGSEAASTNSFSQQVSGAIASANSNQVASLETAGDELLQGPINTAAGWLVSELRNITTGRSVPNFATNATREGVEDTLTTNGYKGTMVEEVPNNVKVFSNGGDTSYWLRNGATSYPEGSTMDIRQGDNLICKIRLGC